MINIYLGYEANGNLCDLTSNNIFQPIVGNKRTSFLTNKKERNFGSFPWGAIIIEARSLVVHVRLVGGKEGDWWFDIFDWSCEDHTAWPRGEREKALGKRSSPTIQVHTFDLNRRARQVGTRHLFSRAFITHLHATTALKIVRKMKTTTHN